MVLGHGRGERLQFRPERDVPHLSDLLVGRTDPPHEPRHCVAPAAGSQQRHQFGEIGLPDWLYGRVIVVRNLVKGQATDPLAEDQSRFENQSGAGRMAVKVGVAAGRFDQAARSSTSRPTL